MKKNKNNTTKMTDGLFALLCGMPKRNLVSLMWMALQLKHKNPDRSVLYCIMESLGARRQQKPSGKFKWKRPTIEAAVEATKVMPNGITVTISE